MELSKEFKKIFGPAVVYTVPVRMTTRSPVLLLNSVTVGGNLDNSETDPYEIFKLNEQVTFMNKRL